MEYFIEEANTSVLQSGEYGALGADGMQGAPRLTEKAAGI